MTKDITMFAGLDVGDRRCVVHVIDAEGERVLEDRMATSQLALRSFFAARTRMRIVLEVGTHSPWISTLLDELGHQVLVANARKLKAIYASDKKTDRVDAEMLARIGRLDPKLLHPVVHRGKSCQKALTLIRSRDALVKARTSLINHVRGVVKAYGHRVPKGSTYTFAKRTTHLPDELRLPLLPVIDTIADISRRLRRYNRDIEALAAEEFPEAAALQQIQGVGPLISVAFIAVVEDPHRFRKNRDVAAYLGLCPRVDQSGDSQRMGHISKAGDSLMRKLLVQGAHYILGWRGPDTDLRRWGLQKIVQHGGQRKRTITAVARKLAVLLLSLWKTGETYQPLRHAEREAA